MKIGIISDTHDRLPTFRRAVELFKRLKVDAIFHAGDLVAPFAAKLIAPDELKIPVHVIYGNNDGERKGLKGVLPQIVDGPLRVELDTPHLPGGTRTVVMAHFIEWFKPTDFVGANVVISGHNHEANIETRELGGKPILFINPGECCGWVKDRCTVAMLDLSEETPKAELIEVHPAG